MGSTAAGGGLGKDLMVSKDQQAFSSNGMGAAGFSLFSLFPQQPLPKEPALAP